MFARDVTDLSSAMLEVQRTNMAAAHTVVCFTSEKWYIYHGCNHLTSIKRKACFENFNHYISTTNGKYWKTLVSLIIKMELNYINIIYYIYYKV